MPEIRKIIDRSGVYAGLMKYRLSLAVAFSSGTGFLLYRHTFGPDILILISGVFLLASGSAVLNQFTERGQDYIMKRTRERPLPSKKVSLSQATALFIFLMVSGSCLLLVSGVIPFTLGLLNVILYNLVYTSLKKVTSLAIIPGALVGAIPPVIGFTAAGGTLFNKEIILFSVFMFLWQVPHFWLILIRYGEEYREAGFVTLSDILNRKQIRNIVFIWILITSAYIMFFFGYSDTFDRNFSSIIYILNIVFILSFSWSLFKGERTSDSRGPFVILNTFGFLVMIILIAGSLFSGT